jgi:multiple sugar transport system substrate-binding protein
MKMTRNMRLSAAVAGAALLLSACTGQAGGSGENAADGEVAGEVNLLTPIFEGDTGKQLLEEELLPQFYEEYPDVTVNIDYTDYGSLNEKLTTSIASGLTPDVMMMGVGWIEGFADRGVLQDLGEIGIEVEDLQGQITEEVLRAGVWEDKLYAVPTMLDARFGIARKDLLAEAGFDQPPSDWEELREYAVALTERDGSGKVTRAGLDVLTLDPRQMFEVFLFSNGGELFSDSGEPAFNSPEGVEALEFIVSLIRDDKVEDIGFSSSDADTYPVINGRAAMMVGHNDVWIKTQAANPEIADQLVPFTINGTEEAIFHGGTLVTVSSQSQNKPAAAALLDFLTGPGASLAANEQRGNVPARTELLESDYVQDNPMVQFAMENLDKAHPEGGVPEWLEIRGDFGSAIEAAILGQKSPQQALDDLAADAQAAIDRS